VSGTLKDTPGVPPQVLPIALYRAGYNEGAYVAPSQYRYPDGTLIGPTVLLPPGHIMRDPVGIPAVTGLYGTPLMDVRFTLVAVNVLVMLALLVTKRLVPTFAAPETAKVVVDTELAVRRFPVILETEMVLVFSPGTMVRLLMKLGN
jgi:hypothetical protein